MAIDVPQMDGKRTPIWRGDLGARDPTPMDVPTVIILGFGILEGSGRSTNDPLLTNDLAHDFDMW